MQCRIHGKKKKTKKNTEIYLLVRCRKVGTKTTANIYVRVCGKKTAPLSHSLEFSISNMCNGKQAWSIENWTFPKKEQPTIQNLVCYQTDN